MHERSVSASLSNIEALALPNRKISDVHAISADNHNYHYFGLEKKLARFLCSPNNCYCRYFNSLRLIGHLRWGLFAPTRGAFHALSPAKLANYPIRTKKSGNYFSFSTKLKTLVTRHLALYDFDYQRIARVTSRWWVVTSEKPLVTLISCWQSGSSDLLVTSDE